MIQELSIRNFAIIDDLKISFSGGLTILSGETGAGKSIILQAVNLLLGGRAGSAMIRSGAETAEIEAFFVILPGTRSFAVMESLGYDPSDGLIVKRIISSRDRHRIYVNGRLATIQTLSAITENLASISGQYAGQTLLREDQHLLILDQFAGLTGLRNEVYSAYHEVLPLIRKIANLKASALRREELKELLLFQKNEIAGARLKPCEDSDLEAERTRLKNAEALKTSVHRSIEILYAGGGAVLERILSVTKMLEKSSQIDPSILSFSKPLEEAGFIIEDAASSLAAYLNSIEADEAKIDVVEARIDFLHKIKRKYGGSIESVISRLNSIENELSEIENLSSAIEEAQEELSDKRLTLYEKSKFLSAGRKESSLFLSTLVERALSDLKMPETRFIIEMEPAHSGTETDEYLYIDGRHLTESGLDKTRFMISPNRGEAAKPLSQIASGGELSRVILALKAILSEKDAVETIIFDEVDAGIGGGVAEVVGKKLLELSKNYQVICITHLPQIARFAEHHFRIFKEVRDGRTATTMQPLSPEQRLKEMARMLGGETITAATLEHARELLEPS